MRCVGEASIVVACFDKKVGANISSHNDSVSHPNNTGLSTALLLVIFGNILVSDTYLFDGANDPWE